MMERESVAFGVAGFANEGGVGGIDAEDLDAFGSSASFEMGEDVLVGKGGEHSGVGGMLFSELGFFLLEVELFKGEGFMGFFAKGDDLFGGIADEGSGLVFGCVLQRE